MKKISLLIPAYNEQEVLEHLYQRIGKLANDNKSYDFMEYHRNTTGRSCYGVNWGHF